MADSIGGSARRTLRQLSPDRKQGGAALRVRTVTAGERPVEGGPAMPVYYVQDSELKQNGGAYTLQGNQPTPIFEAEENAIVEGVAALPVYVTNPVVGIELPEVESSTIILNLQADTGVTTSTAAFSGTGVISQSGTTISGVGTLFRREVVVGDRITAIGIDGIVQSIANDTSLVVDSSAIVGVGVVYTITPQAASARVTAWLDQSGSNHDFTQSGTARPSKQTIGGYPAVVFDGSPGGNDWLLGEDFADNLSSFTVFFVADSKPTGGDALIIGKITETSSSQGWHLISGLLDFYLVQDSGSPFIFRRASAVPTGRWLITAEKISNTELHLYSKGVLIDGTLDSMGTVTDFSSSEVVTIATVADQSTGFTRMKVHSLMIYSPAPNASDRAAIEQWLADRYGITL